MVLLFFIDWKYLFFMIQQPTPRKTDFSTIVHGYALADPYHWLKQKDTQEVLDYLHADNAYMKQYEV